MPPRPQTRNQNGGGRPPAPANPNAVQTAQPAAMTAAEAQTENLKRLKKDLDQIRPQLEALLAGSVDPDRFVTMALLTVQGNGQLAACDRLSLLGAIRESASLGLELSPVLGDGALIPYKGVATFQPEYRGLRKLALRDGTVRAIAADIVYEHDLFSIVSGTEPKIEHRPAFPDRGRILGGYAWARLANGELLHLEMTEPELLLRRNEAKSYRFAERDKTYDSPWHKWPVEMMRKTLIKRLCQEQLPLSPKLLDAIAADTRSELGAVEAARPVGPAAATAQARILARHGIGQDHADEALYAAPLAALPSETGEAVAASGAPASPTPDSSAPLAGEDQDDGAVAVETPTATGPAQPVAVCGSPSPWTEPPGSSTCTKEPGHRLVCSDGDATWETPKGWTPPTPAV